MASSLDGASTTTGIDEIACAAPTSSLPIWGKLVLSGNSVTCYFGTGVAEPANWTMIGHTQTLDLINNPLLIGIYATAHNANAITTATVDHVSIWPTPNYRLTDCDIGAPSLMGSANVVNGVWTINASGADIWGTFDQFNFQPWLVWGDCAVVCRVTSISSGDPWQKVGIMIRDGYNSGSDYAMFGATNGSGAIFQYRQSFLDNGDTVEWVGPPTPGVKASVAIGYSQTGGTAYQVRP